MQKKKKHLKSKVIVLLLTLIGIFFLVKSGSCTIVINVHPCKQTGVPYPYLTQVITQEVIEELNDISGIKVSKSNFSYELYCKVGFNDKNSEFNLSFELIKKGKELKKVSFKVKGDELFIEVKKQLLCVLKSFLVIPPKPKGSIFKKIKSALESLVFLKRGFELNIPVPLPPPPQGFLK
ncbi:MAG: hypothetical protein GXO57_00120 [Thermodesulfobacteria bacterium]|nr:hypothetical protein [Thermodesulfobacteriota bacterium]